MSAVSNVRSDRAFDVDLRHGAADLDECLLDEELVAVTLTKTSFALRGPLEAWCPGDALRIVQLGTAAAAGGSSAAANAATSGARRREHLEAGAVITLPLWAARALCARGVAVMRPPAGFSDESLRDFRADPFLPLVAQTKGARFFDLGAAVCQYLPVREAARVRSAMLDIFRQRQPSVAVTAMRGGHEMTAAFRDKLTTREQRLLTAHVRDDAQRQEWACGH
jgi:hypothetical protein